jgi:hypothetical protein
VSPSPAPPVRAGTGVRPLRRDDLPAAAALVQRGFPGEARRPARALAAFLGSALLDQPWADPELPSLVAEDGDGRVVGFIAAHARRLRHGDRELRAAWCSHLIIDPDQPPAALGMRLLSGFMSGPQDVSLSDTPSDVVVRMWRAAGGRVDPLRSLAWSRVLHRRRWAARLATSTLARRRGSGLVPVRPIALELPPPPAPAEGVELEALTPALLAAQSEALAVPLRPAYDEPFATWLFGQLDERLGAGRVVARLVRRRGRAIGWFAYVRDPGGRGTVLEVAAGPRDMDAVTDALFAAAAADGTLVLTGRLEPHLHDAMRRHRCAIGRGRTAVAHAREPALLAELAGAGSLWTLLAGEWW